MYLRLRNVFPERYIPASTSASSALEIEEFTALRARGQIPQVEVFADGADIIVAFGGVSVAANVTVDSTSKQRDPGMHLVKSGAHLLFELLEGGANYISTITASGSGNLGVRITNGEGY